MNRYLIINKGIVVDIKKCVDLYEPSVTDVAHDTIQLDNNTTHKLNDVFDLNKIMPYFEISLYSAENFTKLGAVDKYEIAVDNDTQNIYIGCTSFVKDTGVIASRTQWEAFTDEEVEVMDNGALEWWKKYKPLVMQLLDVNEIK